MSGDCVAIDRSWGPSAGRCRGGMDFTMTFEESMFCILPAAIIILAAPARVFRLRSKYVKTRKSRILSLKKVDHPVSPSPPIDLIWCFRVHTTGVDPTWGLAIQSLDRNNTSRRHHHIYRYSATLCTLLVRTYV